MNEMKVARGLGWFSIGLGLTEVFATKALGEWLGMEDRKTLLRAFGLREIGAGVAVLAQDNPAIGVWSRVAGDALDIAVLGAALVDEDNPKKGNVALALGAVAGITALDFWCARRLHSGRPHGSMRVHYENVAEGTPPRPRSGLPSGANR